MTRFCKENNSDLVHLPGAEDASAGIRERFSHEGFLVVPWHPELRSRSDEARVFCCCRQVGKGIDLVQLAGMNDAHEQVPDGGSFGGFIEQGPFSEQHKLLNHLFTNINPKFRIYS